MQGSQGEGEGGAGGLGEVEDEEEQEEDEEEEEEDEGEEAELNEVTEIKILFCKHYFSPLDTFMRKGKDPEPDPDPYFGLMDPDQGGPKTCGSGSATLLARNLGPWGMALVSGFNRLFCIVIAVVS